MYNYLLKADDGLLMRSAGQWASVKLDYLRRYIDVFEISMRNKWTVRNYIDLLAGPGKNRIRKTNEILLGSPLLALKAKYPFTGYYFSDVNPINTDALSKRCQELIKSNNIWIKTGDCNILVDQVVEELLPSEHISLNLAFLDPEGLELHWSTVAKLASIRKMDLVINYPQVGLNRCMSKVYHEDGENSVDSFFGTQEWRIIYLSYRRNHKPFLHRELIDLYKSQLKEIGYQEVKRGDEAGVDEPLIRNIQTNAPLYRLIFASKSPLGEKFWHAVTQSDIYGQKRLFDSF